MKLPRRKFLQFAWAAAVAPTFLCAATAQTYPSRPVRLIVCYPAGGANDIIGRLIGQWLSERLGQQFIIENRVGAAGNIGTEAAVRSPADGYTLLLAGSFNSINATLYDKLNFNFIRDIAPVSGILRSTFVMLVNPAFPAKTVPEFIDYAKTNPGKINMASAGSGNLSHVAGELFKAMTGVNMLHVPYRGGAPAMTDLIGGQVQVYFGTISESIEYIGAGRLRALAVATATRSQVLPDIPALGEFVPGYEAIGWQGIGAPKNTPTDIIDKLNKEINAGISDPKLRARLIDLGSTLLPGSAADFGKLIADETEKWAKVIKFANIKAE
jgi:tripartite-type tricarboxylate transporter receptor subunit TctC